MSLSACLQRHVNPIQVIRRHTSTAAKRSKRKLSDEKMRALISLYHQSETFITPENLSERIDEAFTSGVDDLRAGATTVKDLYFALAAQRKAPKIAQWEHDPSNTTTVDYNKELLKWSGMGVGREMKVVEALYGVTGQSGGSNLPGLEVLEEAVESNKIPAPSQDIRDLLKEDYANKR